MKNLVWRVLLAAVASSIGCSGAASVVTAQWSFTHLATNAPAQCGNASDMAVVRAQTWAPDTQTTGTSFSGSYSCAAGRGSLTLSDDTYLVWVEIRTAAGGIVAQSGKAVVDTSQGDQTVDAGFSDDGGYFSFSWDLISKATNGRVSCKGAGSGKVGITATSVATQMAYKGQPFSCEDHFGTTQPLLVDTYTISINALDAGASAAIGDASTLTNQSIQPDQATDLGNIKISVP